jgi:predicted NAD/FAD-binding protein
VVLEDETRLAFDSVVMATHADVTHRLLINPDPEERSLLGRWSYTQNQVTLHTDTQVMPPSRQAWASWSYVRHETTQAKAAMTMSYYMNRLQRLKTTSDYFVTLNGDAWVNPDQRIESILFDHPCYTFDSLSTHAQIDAINGRDRLYFCGAYCGYGFHEDGARSGLRVAQKFGIDL